jgi:Uma2 family endonuclease
MRSCSWRQRGSWARGKGQVGTEWRFRLAPEGEVRRPLVPDVSYVSYDRLRGLSPENRELPPIGPEIAIEVRSPDNHAGYLRHKRSVYFATGTYIVIEIDPANRTIVVDDVDGTHAVFTGDDVALASRYPSLRMSLREVFAELDIPE